MQLVGIFGRLTGQRFQCRCIPRRHSTHRVVKDQVINTAGFILIIIANANFIFALPDENHQIIARTADKNIIWQDSITH